MTRIGIKLADSSIPKTKGPQPVTVAALIIFGAEGETRTPTSIQTLDPEPSVSTNSTTRAKREFLYQKGSANAIKKYYASALILISLSILY